MKRLFPLAFILCLIAGILTACSGSMTRSDIIPDAPPCYVELEMDGEKYMEYASEGQIWMLFKDDVSSEDAVKILTDNNAKIIDQDPDIGYYAVSISVGTEGAFVAKLKNFDEIDFVYPNAIQFENSVSSYVIDNFNGKQRHGERVQELFEKASLQNAEPIDATLFYVIDGEIGQIRRNRGIRYSLKDLSSGNGVVINLSSGVGLDMSEKDWQGDYIKRYVSDLKGLIKLTRKICKDEIDCDFVFVKSSGNECLKHLERVLDGLKKKLDPDEYAFFKEHFILVSARDDNRFQNKKGDYPNDVYDGGYHNMVSKIDISDLTATDSEFSGTSFAAPRLAGYIVRASNQYNMPVTEVLKYVRKVTKESPNHVIDYEMIEKELKQYYREVVNIPGYVDLGLLSGTLWKDANENDFYCYDEALNMFGEELPIVEQFEELIELCSWEWTGNGYEVRGPNGNSIYLPALGSIGNHRIPGYECHVNNGRVGEYWASSLETKYRPDRLMFTCDWKSTGFTTRSDKESITVRLVRKPEYVDLGLKSGTLWKNRNEPDGGYYIEKAKEEFKDQIPTKEQLEELKEQCKWIWQDYGYKVIGPNGNYIFLSNDSSFSTPYGDYRSPIGYWSSTPDNQYETYALNFGTDRISIWSSNNRRERLIRLVK